MNNQESEKKIVSENDKISTEKKNWEIQKEKHRSKLEWLFPAFIVSVILAFALYFNGLGPAVFGIPWGTFLCCIIMRTYYNSATTRDQLEESLEDVVKQNVSLKEQNEQLLEKLERIEAVLNIAEDDSNETESDKTPSADDTETE